MFEKLSSVEERYEDISTRLSDPAVIGDNEKYRSLMKEYKNLTPIVEKYREYRKACASHEEAAELLEEGEVTEDIAALVILLEKAGIIKNYFSPYERGQMKDRLKAIVRSPQGRQVGRMVEYVEGMLSIMTVLMVMYQ